MKTSLHRLAVSRILWLSAALIICVLFLAHPTRAAEPFEFHLLDVGQGQCVLVEADGHYMLIDGGGRDASSYVVSYLQQLGIESLDLVAVSHYDEDHMSGVIGVLHTCAVSQLLLPPYAGEGELYQSFSTAALSNGADITHPTVGESFQLGGAAVQVVGPVRSDYEQENDCSLALRITYGELSCLICGDAEQQSETDMVDAGIELASDLCVVSHHGSASSTSDYFLDAVAPSYALISCGSDNSYGHPAMETLQRLQARGISMYRTDKQGTIIAASDGNSIWFNNEPCEDWTPGTYLQSDVTDPSQGGTIVRDMTAIGEMTAGSAADDSGAADGSGTADTTGTADGSDSSGSVDGAGGGAAGTAEGSEAYTYVCNVNTRKFHYPDCNSVSQMNEDNRLYTTLSRDELIAQGYEPCGNCMP